MKFMLLAGRRFDRGKKCRNHARGRKTVFDHVPLLLACSTGLGTEDLYTHFILDCCTEDLFFCCLQADMDTTNRARPTK